MDYLWRGIVIAVLIAGCLGDNRPVTEESATVKRTITPQCDNCPKKTTTRHTTTHSTLHTNHTTTAPTTPHTNHTTLPPTTAHTNHTTLPPTTAHTNHTTLPPTTAHTNHTTPPPTTAHTNHTTTAEPTPPTNHTTTPHTNHTTAPTTTTPSNHTSTPHTNYTTPHQTSVPFTNHTTPAPTTPPSPAEYFINGTSGVCLRIKAIFMITMNITKIINYTIPSPPTTSAFGHCSADTAKLTLSFPGGSLSLTFQEDKKTSSFYLKAVNVVLRGKEVFLNSSSTFKEMVTPLGRSFTCEEVDLDFQFTVKVVLRDVKAQAFELPGGNFGKELKCTDANSRSKTVPIVVGIVLLVLIIVVVAAYLISRNIRHRSAGYQPL
ncbi:uncharacterized protein [Pyxicephalus adspersus]|uniref:uncharacterized protein n=1 Tax=Pyxicephalus adspersus TaxID=30357 RepID=UPI003B5A2350